MGVTRPQKTHLLAFLQIPDYLPVFVICQVERLQRQLALLYGRILLPRLDE